MTDDNQKQNDFHLGQLASVGQIAAGIAHEVKNPLTAVKGFLQLLEENYEDRYLEIAKNELDNALSTLQNLLQVSKPDLEDEPFESIDLAVEMSQIIHLFQDQIYRVTVDFQISDENVHIYGKKNQIKKALFNLLKNAFEAIPDKGTIAIRHYVKDEKVFMTIKDSGQGIPQEKLNLLGTPFFSTKENGTGMGLTQVFTVIYQHQGKIEVNSKEGQGTQFTISFPKAMKYEPRGVIKLNMFIDKGFDIKQFFTNNRKEFEERLLTEAVNVKANIEEIRKIGNIHLLDNAYRLVLYVVEGKANDVIAFAKAEGIAWAKHSLTLSFKLEWIQAIRRVLWDFLYNYDSFMEKTNNKDDFHTLEKNINELVDQFLNTFFISYSQYKDELLKKQRDMVEDLSVPIIPLTETMFILPLIDSIDTVRAKTIQEKVLTQIGESRIETLIIDLSGTVDIESDVLVQMIRIIEGVKMMGCSAVITGLRPQVVNRMINEGLAFNNTAITKGTLQQALSEYLLTRKE
ncbi:ATP-binding protein [Marinicrinis lubricantis]